MVVKDGLKYVHRQLTIGWTKKADYHRFLVDCSSRDTDSFPRNSQLLQWYADDGRMRVSPLSIAASVVCRVWLYCTTVLQRPISRNFSHPRGQSIEDLVLRDQRGAKLDIHVEVRAT